MAREKYLIINGIPLLFSERNVARQTLIEIWLSENLDIGMETLHMFYFKKTENEVWRQYIC